MDTKDITDALEGIKSQVDSKIDSKINEPLAAIQKHLDKLDVKLQGVGGKGSVQTKETDLKSSVYKSLISKENEIKNMTNDKLQIKSVYTSDVTGVAPRTFRNDVVLKPNALVNVTDLVGSVSVMGGAYTYAVETVTGAPAVQVEGASKADVSIDFEYKTVSTQFIAGITEVSRQFLNNYTSLTASIPSIMEREYYRSENTLYSAALVAAATASTVTGTNPVKVLTEEISRMMGNNIMPTAVVVNPIQYAKLLLNETTASSGYDLPAVVTVSPEGMVFILGVPLYQATWITAGTYLVFNGNKIVDAIQENINIQIDSSEKFSKNISIFRIEKQSALCIMAPAEIIKGTIA